MTNACEPLSSVSLAPSSSQPAQESARGSRSRRERAAAGGSPGPARVTSIRGSASQAGRERLDQHVAALRRVGEAAEIGDGEPRGGALEAVGDRLDQRRGVGDDLDLGLDPGPRQGLGAGRRDRGDGVRAAEGGCRSGARAGRPSRPRKEAMSPAPGVDVEQDPAAQRLAPRARRPPCGRRCRARSRGCGRCGRGRAGSRARAWRAPRGRRRPAAAAAGRGRSAGLRAGSARRGATRAGRAGRPTCRRRSPGPGPSAGRAAARVRHC